MFTPKYTPRISSTGKPRETLEHYWKELFPELPLPDPSKGFFESWQLNSGGYDCVAAMREGKRWLALKPVGTKSTDDLCRLITARLKARRLAKQNAKVVA